MSDAGTRYDGVILGAGAAGLMAALRAGALGARVALVDAGGGSNLEVSSGLFSAAGTRWQAAAGIADGAARWAGDIVAKASGAVDPVILGVVTGRSAEVAHFIADGLGLPVRVVGGLSMPGHTAARLHEADRGGGAALAALLWARVRGMAGVTVIDGEATGLLTEGGRVVGAALRDGAVRGAWTLLAMGGFGANRAMVAAHAPEILGAVYIGRGPNLGLGHAWGVAAGGSVSMMDSYQGQGHTTPDGLGRLGPGLTSFGAIVVNQRGERFADEAMGPSEFGAFVLAQPGGTAVEVFDDRIHGLAQELSTYRATDARGLVVRGDAAGIAGAFGLPPGALDATLAEYAGVVAGGADRFGRAVALQALVPPYRAARVTGALAHTQGGLLVDAGARVVGAAGLLAAGAAVAGISGHGAAGYLPGNGLGHAFALGFVAGETMAGR